MWTVTVGTTTGVSQFQINAAVAIVQGAANYWGRYINDSLASIAIQVNFRPLADLTLAQAGTEFVLDRSAGGFDFFEAITIRELRTGTDSNGSTRDINIDIDTGELLANEFYLGALVDGLSANVPSNQFDLFTIILHEIGHGLGILSFLDDAGNDRSDFDERVVQTGGNFFFNGPAATAVYGGNVPLDASIAHLAGVTGSLLRPSFSAGQFIRISRLDTAVLQDIGIPIRATTSGADLLWGYLGDESLLGEGGNDTLNGFGGLDTLIGGDGNDVLNALGASASLDGGNGNDTLNGASLGEVLQGGAGDDLIVGGAGNDQIVGGAGADTINGGDGIDSTDYFGSAPVSVNLTTGAGSGGDAAGDSLISIERVFGTAGADTLVGSANADYFTTNGGGDLVEGLDGSDTLSSNSVSTTTRDTLIGGAGADSFVVNSVLGAIVSYSTSPGGVLIDLATGAGQFNDAAGDTFGNVASIEGSNFNDTLLGFGSFGLFLGLDGNDLLSSPNGFATFDGGSGNDTLIGSHLNDTLIGGDGDDLLDGGADGGDDIRGGAGFDFVTYANAAIAVVINLTNTAANAGAALDDTVRGDVDGLIGTSFNDFLQGNSLDNNLQGGSGNDTLIGGFGNDVLIGGAGADSINGGDGFDIASYENAAGPVRVALWNPASNSGEAAGDIINFQVEVIAGSAFADNLQGNTSDNNLRGGAGNDLVLGGFGDDTLIGGAGADDFGGGEGFDVVSYATSTAPIRIALWSPAFHTGDAAGDNIRADIEAVDGSLLNDTLEGSASANNLRGGGGADFVAGGGGDDTLWGQAGNDTLIGGAGNDLFIFDASGGADRIGDYTGGPGASDTINLTGFGAAFDTFVEVIAASIQAGVDTVIDFGAGNVLTLANVDMATLDFDDFTFS